ncbi:MAG TPA: hypothetical protein VGX68_08180 [Thermoanaerobaculia bacterium]|jgi:hypothetical protein|nr:hypothetical protein [Thermoanaerobaculia bacterium]
MARDPKYGVTINGWERLLVAFAANAADFTHLDEYRVQLEQALDQLREAAAQQAALRAGKQEASRRLQSHLIAGKKAASFLRHGVRRRYGDSSEKLAEFDLKPFRSRRLKPEDEPPVGTEPPVIESPAPPEAEK